MKQNELINGYRILQNFTSAGGGLSKWTFAEKNRKVYFIKEFLHPTFPLPNAPGSEKVKSRKRKQCEVFEAHHQNLMDAINNSTIPGGNLIATLDFFRHGSKYYKVTEKVDVSSIKPAQIARLPIHQRVLIMTTVAHSLRILHKKEVVHGDIKLDNVLIKKTRMGSYTSKLIDFDSAYFHQKPPEMASDVVGDMVFYSPELAKYIRQDPGTLAEHLTIKSDIFALGLLYSLYLTGKLPTFNMKKYPYAWVAINSGDTLVFDDEDVSAELRTMINSMLNIDFNLRPSVEEVFNQLREIIKKAPKPKVTVPIHEAPANHLMRGGAKRPTNLKGKMIGADKPKKMPVKKIPPKPDPKDEGGSSSLKGTLLGGKKDKKD